MGAFTWTQNVPSLLLRATGKVFLGVTTPNNITASDHWV